MGRPITTIFICLLLQCGGAHAFRLFRHLDVTNGLPSYQVYAIAQDKHGLIWIGTENGLAEYDGHTVTVFRHDSGKPSSLSGNEIHSIFVTRKGQIWIGTNAGLDLYAPNNSFQHIALQTGAGQFASHDAVNTIIQTRNGNIWIGTNNNGLYSLSDNGTLLAHYSKSALHLPSLTDNSVKALFEDNTGHIWIGTANGLNILDETSGEIVHRFHTENPSSLSSNNVYAIAGSAASGIWVGTFSGLNLTHDNGITFTRYLHDPNNPQSLPNNFIHGLLLGKNGTVWVSTYLAGLAEFDPQTSSFRVYKHSISNPYSIADGDVWGLMLDTGDTLWVATDNGVSFTNLRNIPITYLIPSSANTGHSLSSPPNILTAFGTHLLAGVNKGLDIYDEETRQFKHIPINTLLKIRTTGSSDSITSIWQGDDRHIFLGTLNGKLVDLAKQSDLDYTSQVYASPFVHHSVLTIFPVSRTELLLSTTHGELVAFNLKTHLFRKILTRPSLSGDYLSLVTKGSGDTLLVGGYAGLYAFHMSPESRGTKAFTLDYGERLSQKAVLSWYKQSNTSFWLGTGRGLDHLCLTHDGHTVQCTENRGTVLPQQRIKGIEADSHGALWLDTGVGLYEYFTKTGVIRDFGTAQGLPFENFFERSYAKTADGTLWFGGNDGIIGMTIPADVSPGTPIPRTVITKVVSPAGTILMQPDERNTDNLIVDYNDRNLVIDYTATDFSSPKANHFKYRLVGFDSNWIDAGNSREVSYTNLNPGDYQFEVRGTNNWGSWSKEPAILKIRVLAPVWRTWWAYSLYSLLVLGVMLFYVHSQQRKLRKEREISARLRDADAIKSNFVHELESQVSKATADLKNSLESVNLKNQELEIAHRRASEGEQIKSQFLANMSHELRTPLTAILGYLKLLQQASATQEQVEYLRTAQHSAESLLAIINDTLDLSRIESGKLLIDEVDFDLLELVENTVELLGPSAFAKRLRLVRIIPPEIPLQLRGDPLRIRQILTNLVGNAIKFTQSGSVCIRVQELDRRGRDMTLGIAVSDTGMGIPASAVKHLFEAYARHDVPSGSQVEGTGLGLSICKKLLDLMGGDIEVLSTPGVGSTFEFRLTFRMQKLPAARPTLAARPRIGLFDPHPLSHQGWHASLSRLGCEVTAIRDTRVIADHDMDALIAVPALEDVERIQERILEIGNISVPHMVLTPTAEAKLLDRVSEVCRCRVRTTLIRESQLLSEIQALVPAPVQAKSALHRTATATRDSRQNVDADNHRPLILVADDNAINRKLLVTILRQNQYRVLEAANGEELIALAAKESWDAALVDIHMPDMDGVEATQKLLALNPGVRSPVIAVSADALPETRASAKAAGMADYLVKPYTEEQLLEVLRRNLPA